ncbi:MAG TPA: transglutaminase-like domain-containing protein, partial [Candidatus Dormibacteraeota bacterium]|nr:transglutaminase-like domain-containing protein [Candidatus Dormibacteraeota bacterium]
LTSYLQTNFRYSQQLGRVPTGQDPVDWFLFNVKIGYCEQFATAEALMLRSLGIPARLATGYSTGQYDSVLNQATVREQDAHAWVEVWFPNHGWVPVDPSPGFSALAATQFPNRWAAGGVARLIPRLELGAPLAAIGSFGILGVIPPAVAIALLLVIVWAWLRKRHWRGRVRARPGESELLQLYELVQRRLGRRRAPPETPLEYRHIIRSTLSPPPPGGGLGTGAVPLDSLLEEITEAVNEGVYAGRWPDPKAVRELSNRLS